jgi:cyclopropane fatty-acyl-phospholipid synthase-like methyltransferase
VTSNRGYEDLYETFDSPLARQIRREAYGEDVGQHSWATAEELRECIPQLRLSPTSRILDIGCGPAGPLTLIVGEVGCRGVGLDVSAAALEAGSSRVSELGLDRLITLLPADSNEPIPFGNDSFEAVISVDVVLHLQDRSRLFREVVRVLVPGGRFWFTDAGVLTGPVSVEEAALRSPHGYTQLAPVGFNDRALEAEGFRILSVDDRTADLLANAAGRLAARIAHRDEMEALEGAGNFEQQKQYLETVIALARRGAMSRLAYLAEPT